MLVREKSCASTSLLLESYWIGIVLVLRERQYMRWFCMGIALAPCWHCSRAAVLLAPLRVRGAQALCARAQPAALASSAQETLLGCLPEDEFDVDAALAATARMESVSRAYARFMGATAQTV